MIDTVRIPDYFRLPGMADAGEGGADDKPNTDDKPKSGDETKDEPKVFDEKYVKELREENKARRLETEDQKKRLDDLKTQFAEFTKKTEAEKTAMLKALGVADQTDDDPVKAALNRIESLEQKLKEKDTALNRKEIYTTFLAEAQKAGMSPEMVEDAFRLAELKDVVVNPDTGKAEGIDKVIEELKDKKSFLFTPPKNAGSGGEPPKEGDKVYSDEVKTFARQLGVDEEYAAGLLEKRKKDAKEKSGDEGEGRISRAISAFKGIKPPRSMSGIE